MKIPKENVDEVDGGLIVRNMEHVSASKIPQVNEIGIPSPVAIVDMTGRVLSSLSMVSQVMSRLSSNGAPGWYAIGIRVK